MGRPKRARLPPPNLQASKGGRLKIQLPTAHGTLGGPAARSVRPRPRRGVGTRGQEERAPGAAVRAEGARQLHEAGREGILGRGDGMGRGPGGTLSQNGQEASVAERMGGPELRAEAPRREAKGWGGESARVPPCPSQSAHTADTDGCGSPRQAVLCATHGWPTAYLSPTRLHPP